MAGAIAHTFSHKFDKKFQVLDIPSCFDSLHGKDILLEVSISNTLLPLRLLYIDNIVTRSIGFVFINSWNYVKYDDDISMAKPDFEAGKAAVELLYKLEFDEVTRFVALSKSQCIEKLDLLQCTVDEFSEGQLDDASTQHALAIAIITIGRAFNFETARELDKQHAMLGGYVQPGTSTLDGSEFIP